MPISASFSISSRVWNTERSSMRVPPSLSKSRIDMSVVGIASFGAPDWSAKPSVRSSDSVGSTAVIRHQPWNVSPSGEVM